MNLLVSICKYGLMECRHMYNGMVNFGIVSDTMFREVAIDDMDK